MKKLFSLSVASLLVIGAQAQMTQMNSRFENLSRPILAPGATVPTVSLGSAAKTTATPFWTENFSSGTTTTLPAGWTATGNVPQQWKWNNVAETSRFTAFLGTINSTTKANGWLVFNADTAGRLNPGVPIIESRVASPSFSCVGHSSVLVSFQELFRKFTDSCFLEVSGDNGATYTSFPVTVNNSTIVNTTLPNPTTISINVSSVAANQPNVRIRFHYKATRSTSGDVGYLWAVDDVAVSELEPVDLELSQAAFIMTLRGNAGVTNGPGFTSFSAFPRQLVDTVYPQLSVSNRGSTAPANVSFDANVTGPTGTSVYSRSVIFTSVPVNTLDSVIEYEAQAGFVPTVNGTYTGAFSTAPAGEATPANNVDTADFSITDTLLSRNDRFIVGSFDVHSTGPERSLFLGAFMEIPAGKSDTITGASVIFDSRTTSGTNATVQIYKFDAGQWNFVGTTQSLTLTPANISTSTTPTYTYFPILITPTNVSRYILNGGTSGARYAVVVQGNGNPASSLVLVRTSASIASRNIGASGIASISQNDGGTDFGQSSPVTGLQGSVVPFVRLHFGHYKAVDGVAKVNGVVGSVTAYPNPSSTQLFVPVTLSKAADLSVTLSTPMGQVVARQDFGKVGAGQEVKATFNTAGLANGIYFYTVEVSGERITNRVVVSH